MIRNITDEQARHMVELLKKKSVLIKNFSHKLEKYRISGYRETYNKKFIELLEKEEIKVYGKNRALVDICRSLCHELVHCSQDEKGELVGVIRDAGGEIEDEANARAGELIKLFAKSNPQRKSIYESILRRLS